MQEQRNRSAQPDPQTQELRRTERVEPALRLRDNRRQLPHPFEIQPGKFPQIIGALAEGNNRQNGPSQVCRFEPGL